MIEVKNLVKNYGKFRAVNDLSFSIPKGHIYGFVGANGAGKTTTMKIIAGLHKADSGTVIVDGIDIRKNPNGVKNIIGYMPDFFGVYDDLKVTEYMDFYAAVYGVEKKDRESKIDKLIELVNLSDKKDFYVDNLSRGMKQRLCLARSLIHNPELLILDEPASGLDPKARIEMKDILKELKNMNKTILISSHILPELSEMCTSIGILEKGKMVASGTVDDIKRQLNHSKVIVLKIVDNLEVVSKFLLEEPKVKNVVEENNNELSFEFDGSEVENYELIKKLIENNIKVCSFFEKEKNLESVFISLISNEEGV